MATALESILLNMPKSGLRKKTKARKVPLGGLDQFLKELEKPDVNMSRPKGGTKVDWSQVFAGVSPTDAELERVQTNPSIYDPPLFAPDTDTRSRGTRPVVGDPASPFNPSEGVRPDDGPLTVQAMTLTLPPSSVVQSATYWPQDQKLQVWFVKGGTYYYNKIPQSLMIAWMQAKSAGSFFCNQIRTSFEYTKG